MSSVLSRHDPLADPKAVVVEGSARFTVLTPSLIRIEYAPPGGAFEDRASHAFINRRLDVPRFEVKRASGRLVITTDRVEIVYRPDGKPFHAGNLSAAFTVSGTLTRWTPGTPDTGNLQGTTRTLDMVSGSTHLEPGLLSRDGWVVVDDSDRLLFTADERRWAAARPKGSEDGAIDWYLFAHGRDYQAALRDFTSVAGRIPLPPRYVFGSWWSRYWAYSDAELKDLVRQHAEHGVPVDVLVIDMDWHLDGWTGYTWNPDYFPDPAGFLTWCRENHLRTTLNLHPADGVGKHEAAFPAMKAAMGITEKSVYRIPFDCTDPRFVDAYFKILHHPLERQGIDFWWMDWQQGTTTAIPGLDPLYWLNHLHWEDMETNAERAGLRPLVFSRWGGLGNHRYQIGFSGDTFSDWQSLAFQPPFTATAGNVGYAYWSHDIGGHQPGPVDPELYIRWIQWGAFSPILRTHTTKREDAERRIWAFGPEVLAHAREAFHLRYHLIPYIYSACRTAYDEALPLCRPLYYHWPDLDEAYRRPGQYLFGDDILIAPVTQPANPASGCAEADLWLPPGAWTDWFTGRTITGADTGEHPVRALVPIGEWPMFVREGAVIPAAPPMTRTGEKPVDPLILHVFPARRGEIARGGLYEDDGLSSGYQSGKFTRTPVAHRREGRETLVTIGPRTGSFDGMLTSRACEIRLRDAWPAESVTIDGKPAAAEYDPATLSVVVRVPAGRPDQAREVRVLSAVPADHDDTLRRGLRGQLNLIDDLVALLADAAPAELREAAALRREIAAARGPAALAVAERAALLQKHWWKLVRAVNAASAPPEVRTQALARLLGVCSELKIRAGSAADTIAAEADVAFAPRFDEPQDIAVEVAFRTTTAWTIARQDVRRLRPLHLGEHLAASVTLAPSGGGKPAGGGVRTGALIADVTVREEGTAFSLATRARFCPSINAWAVVGPFDCPHTDQLRTEFEPERRVDLAATYTGLDGRTIAWKRLTRTLPAGADPQAEFFIDLQKTLDAKALTTSPSGDFEDCAAYAFCHLIAPRRTDAVLAIGSDDGVVAWINGREVHRKWVARGYASRQDRVRVTLEPGVNTLLLKIGQAKGGWSFAAHLETPDGVPLDEIEVRLP
ncbi:MAG: DUF5110 domain-containing protein [Phycisphaerales bacterium]|nr:DUF5110 domain-containing protein [Phycisphaerales bacterium]